MVHFIIKNLSDMLQAKLDLANLCLFTFFLLFINVRETISVKVELLTVYQTSVGVTIVNGKIIVKTNTDVKVKLLGQGVANKKISFAHQAPDKSKTNGLCDDFRKTETFQTDSKGLVTLNFKVNLIIFLVCDDKIVSVKLRQKLE